MNLILMIDEYTPPVPRDQGIQLLAIKLIISCFCLPALYALSCIPI